MQAAIAIAPLPVQRSATWASSTPMRAIVAANNHVSLRGR
jgi:hypothetical protein